MKSTDSDVCYFEVNAVFNGEPVELLDENTWTARLRRTDNDTGKEILCFLCSCIRSLTLTAHSA